MAGVEYIISLKDKFSPVMAKARSGFAKIDKSVNKLNNSISGTTVALAGVAIGFAAIKTLKLAGEFEQTRVAFDTMLGSAEKGQQVLSELAEFATKTPFSIKGVEKNAKLLLAVGIEVDNLLPTMKALGDVSSGLNVPLERLALNFGQVKSQGKLTGRELRDFAIAGVPIIAELSKNLGVNTATIQKMVSAGSIGFNEVAKAFETMSGEGGKFFNLMDKQNKTFLGGVNELTENFQLLGRQIGQILIPIVRPFIDLMAKMVKFMKDNKILVDFLVKSLGTMVLVIGSIIIAIKAWVAIQTVINILMTLNPIGLIIVAIGLLIAIIGFAVHAIVKWVRQNEDLMRTLNGVKEVVMKTWNVIRPFVMFIWNVGSKVYKKFIELQFQLGKAILNALVTPIKIAFDMLQKFFGLLSKIPLVNKIFGKIKNAFNEGFNKPSGVEKGGLLNPLTALGGLTGGITGGLTGGSEGQTTKVTSAAPKVFNINIDKLVEKFTVETTNIQEGTDRIKEMITTALMEGVADFQTR